MANYNIQGNLPFSGGGKDYASAYNAALQMNSTNYQNILSGFQQTAAQNQQVQQGIQSGYDRLQGDVLGGIQGIDLAQRQAIQDQYVANSGAATQKLINRGLGNSTVQSAVDRGLQYDRSKADVALTGQTQGINAQYRSQLGLAGLSYQERAAAQNQQFAAHQLDWMNSVNAAYPNASAYAQLAMARGQSAGGGGVGPGGISYGGSVKSPLGSGTMAMPNNAGWTSYGSGFGSSPKRNPTNREPPNPEELNPERDAGVSGGWGGESSGFGYDLNGYDMAGTYGTPGESWFLNDQGNWEGDQSGAVTGNAGWGQEGKDWNWIDE